MKNLQLSDRNTFQSGIENYFINFLFHISFFLIPVIGKEREKIPKYSGSFTSAINTLPGRHKQYPLEK